jgi:hypothetical protein
MMAFSMLERRMRWEIFPFVLALGCDQATLTVLPDSGEDAAPCVTHAVPFCDAAASGCVGTGAADSSAGSLPADAAFPIGCSANVIGTDRDPITGVCKLAATCTCQGDEAGANAAWVCSP